MASEESEPCLASTLKAHFEASVHAAVLQGPGEFVHPAAPSVKWRVKLGPAMNSGPEDIFVWLSCSSPADRLPARISVRFGKTALCQSGDFLFKGSAGRSIYRLPRMEGAGEEMRLVVEVEYKWEEAAVARPSPAHPLPVLQPMRKPKAEFHGRLDAYLEAGGELFRVCKYVLACVSPVFGALFSQRTATEAGDRVLVDASAGALELLLRFVYRTRWWVEEEAAEGALCGALELAHRYQVPGLAEAVEEELVGRIRPASVLPIAAAADLNGSRRLFRACRDAVMSGRVALPEDWEEFAKAHPCLIPKLYIHD